MIRLMFLLFLGLVDTLLLPLFCFSQIIFTYTGNDTVINIEPNIEFVRQIKLIIDTDIITNLDGKQIVDIPVAFKLTKNKNYFFHRNHVCQYLYNPISDQIIYGGGQVLTKTINFISKQITESYKASNVSDHFRPDNVTELIRRIRGINYQPIIIE